jgi:hypothetical protein
MTPWSVFFERRAHGTVEKALTVDPRLQPAAIGDRNYAMRY